MGQLVDPRLGGEVPPRCRGVMEAVAPSVIDEELLSSVLKDEMTRLAARDGIAPKQEEIRFEDVVSLPLSFHNILDINNLFGFDKLVKLQLDNNVIRKIQNLDHLTSLTWLDLSFNNITQIEGLDTLANLETLTLFHNKIKKLSGLD